MNAKKDRLNSLQNNDKARAIWEEYAEKSKLTDIWRNLNKSNQYSWFRRKPGGGHSASRIDMVFYSD